MRESGETVDVDSQSEVEADVESQDANTRVYMGEVIRKHNGRWYWADTEFTTLGKAKNAIKEAKP